VEAAVSFAKDDRVYVKESQVVGSVVEIPSARRALVKLDTGEIVVFAFEDIDHRGPGRLPGQGRKEPVPPTREVKIERRLAEVVKKEMDRQNLTQAELAKRTGMSRRTVQRVLAHNGHKQSIETLESLAEALGITPSRFWEVDIVNVAAPA
jgi:DNA-binding Xre family transcriptional regulator